MNVRNNLMADAVFEGGGVKGIGLAGAVAVAEERGYQWVNVAGTSAGAIVAALLAAGYSAAEMKEIMEELDYSRFKDASLLDRVPLVGPVASLIFEKGIYEGKWFEHWMRELLRKKKVETFKRPLKKATFKLHPQSGQSNFLSTNLNKRSTHSLQL